MSRLLSSIYEALVLGQKKKQNVFPMRITQLNVLEKIVTQDDCCYKQKIAREWDYFSRRQWKQGKTTNKYVSENTEDNTS